MPTHPEALLVSAMLREQDVTTHNYAGITIDHFHVYASEWRWLERFMARYKKTPGKATFRGKFPDFPLRAVNDVEHFAEEVKREHARFLFNNLVDSSLDFIEADDMDAAVSALRKGIGGIEASLAGNSGEFSLLKDADLVFQDVKHRVETAETTGYSGVPTGFKTLDLVTGGVQEGDYWVVGARLGMGKAIQNGTGVLTPRGYVPVESLIPGDLVIGSNGKPTRVVGVFPQGHKMVLDVKFSDGSVASVCEDHLWNVRVGTKPWKIQTTKQISKHSGQNYAIPTAQPVHFAETRVPYDAYQLGLLLGDGCFRGKMVQFSTADPELVFPFGANAHYYSGYDYGITRLTPRMKSLGLWGKRSEQKFVPPIYLRASITNRLAILQGLLDTDGSPIISGGTEFSTTSYQLAKDVQHLAETLGGYVHWHARQTHCNGKPGLPSYRLIVVLPPQFAPFRLKRKLTLHKPRSKFPPVRTIREVIHTDRYEPMTCIAVESPDSLFLIEHCLVTHNTWTLNQMTVNAMQHGTTSLFVTLEQTKNQIAFRLHNLLSSKYGRRIFSSTDLLTGRNFSLIEYRKFLETLKITSGLGDVHIMDGTRGRVNAASLGIMIEKIKPGIVFIDYITLLDTREKDWQSIAKLSNDIQATAMRFGVPIVVAAQINRLGEGTDPPKVNQLGMSDAIGQDADVVLTLAQKSAHVVKFRLAKFRNGQDQGLWYCEFNPMLGIYGEISGNKARELIEKDMES